MDLASIAHHYLDRYKQRYGQCTDRDQWSALNAILGCRTLQYGKVYLSCRHCPAQSSCYQSCGHRSCNQCQHFNTTQWLERQTTKLLPVEYFMVTFTLPAELRGLARKNQKQVYAQLFQCAMATLNTFAKNDPAIRAELAATAVLHTHSRKLNYHPHVHLIVPGGWVDAKRKHWYKLKGNYLFNSRLLARVFRGKLLTAMKQLKLAVPESPGQWIAHCQKMGKGLPALQYLSRYLYRGVIANKRICHDDGTHVTFEYRDSESGRMHTRSLRGEDFIKLVLQHTLPKGFRRVRDYGWLHGNAKKLLRTIQWVLQVSILNRSKSIRPKFRCVRCQSEMAIVGFGKPGIQSG